MNKQGGFILIEAAAAVVVVSVSLTLITQSLMANTRTGLRFQETVRSLFVMENVLGMTLAVNGAGDSINSQPSSLNEPYQQMTAQAFTRSITDGIKQVDLTVTLNKKKGQQSINASTYILNAQQVKRHNFMP